MWNVIKLPLAHVKNIIREGMFFRLRKKIASRNKVFCGGWGGSFFAKKASPALANALRHGGTLLFGGHCQQHLLLLGLLALLAQFFHILI